MMAMTAHDGGDDGDEYDVVLHTLQIHPDGEEAEIEEMGCRLWGVGVSVWGVVVNILLFFSLSKLVVFIFVFRPSVVNPIVSHKIKHPTSVINC